MSPPEKLGFGLTELMGMGLPQIRREIPRQNRRLPVEPPKNWVHVVRQLEVVVVVVQESWKDAYG